MSTPPVLILGARSDIGLAVAHAFAQQGHPVQLAARDAASLAPDQADIATRHDVEVTLHEFDALDIEGHDAFVESLADLPEIAVCAVGLMGDQEENTQDILAAARVMRSNFEGPAGILAMLANRFETRGTGTLVGISSVAGERGRATNYIYGSAKSGFTAFLSGLRNRLAKKGVHVVTVLPGFVNTQMTAGMDLPAPLTAEPKEVAEKIVKAVSSGRNIVYVRPVWRLIMAIIKAIPEGIFKGMKI
ncbi:MAG: SDR family oxidoreductase [Pseudomonadota bacterium]